MGGGSDDHCVEVVGLVSGANGPAVILPDHRLHGRRGLERFRIQTRDQGIDHLLHAIFERSEQRPRWEGRRCSRFLARFFTNSEHGAAQAAVFRFHVSEARQHGAHAQLGSFAAVNSGEQRIGKQVDHLGTVVAFDHLGNGFVFGGLARQMKPLGGHANFCAHGEKRRENRGHDFGGHHEHEAIGHHHQFALGKDVGLALGVVRADELVAQINLDGRDRQPMASQ